ncbi:hypothetical protein CK203_028334 [Vitis vinifera]|uniref:Reverse transcriptase zinc-binding domain-containing protein n=1 Tax=Vitis vinifera TaxID=29760 RepID=A0A438J056_VITVI|nr:hypothetical protein CK203_028334 [Vitis vinifera]
MVNRGSLCKDSEESANHILIHCDKPRKLWTQLLTIFGLVWVFPASMRNLLLEWKVKGLGKKRRAVWRLAPICLFSVFGKSEMEGPSKRKSCQTKPCTQFRRTLSSRTTPDNLIAVGSPPRRQPFPANFFRRPATLSGEFFQRPLFRAPTTYSEPPEADLHASGNPHRQPESHAPPRADLPRRTVTHAPARDGAWLTFRPRPTHLQARPAASWPSSPPAAPPEPCISTFCSVFGFLAIPTTSDRASSPSPRLGYCFSSSPGTSRPFSPLIAPLTAVVSLFVSLRRNLHPS